MKYSVQQAAAELGVTPQAVYKKLRSAEIWKHVSKDGSGRTMISADGLKILKDRSAKAAPTGSTPKEAPDAKEKTGADSFADLLGDQLRQKDQQIAELMKQNADLLDKLQNFQILLANEQQQKTLLLEHGTGKKGWFDRFRKRAPDEQS